MFQKHFTSRIRCLLSLMQKRFMKTSTALPTASSSSSFTLQFLVNSCGLPLQSALSVSKNLQFHDNNIRKPYSVLELLKSHDFNDTQIAELIEKRPQILQSRAKSNLEPKFDFFVKIGFVGKLLPELILSDPGILKSSLNSNIKPYFEFLKLFLDSNEKIIAAVKRCPWLLTTRWKSSVRKNLDFLTKEGVPLEKVAKLVVMHPRAVILKHDKMVYAVNSVKNLGIEPKSAIFISAVRVMTQMSESTWKKKMEVMKSIGWSEEEILWAFKRYPNLLGCSEENIRNTMDFLVKTVKLGSETIIRQPKFLTYSIDKRLRPRYNVFKVLQSNKLIKEHKKFEQLINMSEKDFLENYVTKYADKVLGLREIYGGTTKEKEIDT